MIRLLMITVLALILMGEARSQSARVEFKNSKDSMDVSYEQNSLFWLQRVNYYRPHTYVVHLRKGQKIEISNGWRQTDNLPSDPRGVFNADAPGFQIILPNAKVIKPRHDTYILQAKTDGAYKVVVAPVYKKINSVHLSKEKRIDYLYKIFFTLL